MTASRALPVDAFKARFRGDKRTQFRGADVASLPRMGSSSRYRHAEVMKVINNDVMRALATRVVFLFDPERLTPIYSGVDASKFSGDTTRAIETRVRLMAHAGAALSLCKTLGQEAGVRSLAGAA
jgi:hypothetical protein